MMRSIKEIDKEIEIAKKAHAAAFTEDQKKEMQELLDELEVEKKDAEEKGAKKSAPPKAPKPAPAKKFPAKKPEHEKKEDKEEGKSVLITVAGKEYDIEDCKQAILALKARKHQAKKSGHKYKTKKPAVKAADNAEDMIGQIADAIPHKKAEDNPKQVISVLKEFRTKMDSAFNVLAKIISKQDVAVLKKSLKEIDEIIAKYNK